MGSETIDLLWRERPPATRGPKAALTVDQIVGTAIDLADREGLDAVTLQRVAEAHGYTKMALYRYVSGKDDLVALMVDTAVGAPPVLSRRAGWRTRASRFCDAVSEHWERHPWLPWATVGDRLMGPRETGWVQAGLTVFDGTGLTTRERLDATTMLFGHLRNTHSVARAGTLPWTAGSQSGRDLERALATRPDDFATLSAALEEVDGSPDRARSFGLTVILDGLEALVVRRADRG